MNLLFQEAAHSIERDDPITLLKLISSNPQLIAMANLHSNTLLHIAARNRMPNICSCLIKMGADANCITKGLLTPLHLSVNNNDPKSTYILLQNGADVNAADNNGWTALHSAAHKGFVSIIKILLVYSPIITQKDSNGKTAIDRAKTGEISYLITNSQNPVPAQEGKETDILNILDASKDNLKKLARITIASEIETRIKYTQYSLINQQSKMVYVKANKFLDSLVEKMNAIISYSLNKYDINANPSYFILEADITNIRGVIASMCPNKTIGELPTLPQLQTKQKWETNKEMALLQEELREECAFLVREIGETNKAIVSNNLRATLNSKLRAVTSMIQLNIEKLMNERLFMVISDCKAIYESQVPKKVKKNLLMIESPNYFKLPTQSLSVTHMSDKLMLRPHSVQCNKDDNIRSEYEFLK